MVQKDLGGCGECRTVGSCVGLAGTDGSRNGLRMASHSRLPGGLTRDVATVMQLGNAGLEGQGEVLPRGPAPTSVAVAAADQNAHRMPSPAYSSEVQRHCHYPATPLTSGRILASVS